MKRLLLSLIATALIGGGVAVAGPASAADYLQSGVGIRSGYYTTTTLLGRGYPGDGVTYILIPTTIYGSTYSYSNSRYGTGTSNVWQKHTNNTSGITGFSGAYFLG